MEIGNELVLARSDWSVLRCTWWVNLLMMAFFCVFAQAMEKRERIRFMQSDTVFENQTKWSPTFFTSCSDVLERIRIS